MKRICASGWTLSVALVAFALQSMAQLRPLTDEGVLRYASQPYDKALYRGGSVILGSLNSVDVVVDYICSDLCPAYTVRIIRFAADPGPACAAVGGIEKSVIVPRGVASGPKVFCFPKVLVDNWNAYVR
jgi:hypothetical protein